MNPDLLFKNHTVKKPWFTVRMTEVSEKIKIKKIYIYIFNLHVHVYQLIVRHSRCSVQTQNQISSILHFKSTNLCTKVGTKKKKAVPELATFMFCTCTYKTSAG